LSDTTELQQSQTEQSTPSVETKPDAFRIKFVPHEHLMRTGNDPVRMFRELEMLGEVSATAHFDRFPGFSEIDPTCSYLWWELDLRGDVDETQINEVFEWVEGDCDLEITPHGGGATAPEATNVAEEIQEVQSVDEIAQSVSAVKALGDTFASQFYEKLFEKYPDVKPLFSSSSIHEQSKKLWQVLSVLADNLNSLETLKPTLIELGKRHQKYGATKAHYAAVAEILVSQLSTSLGDLWTDTAKSAWVGGLEYAAQTMLSAYEQTESPATNTPAPKPAATNVSTPKKAAAAGESSSIRVSIDKVDALINMVGELVITQSMLGQLGEDIDMSKIENLKDGLAQLERNTRELQESVMRIRMLPISFAFQRFPRMVRDLTQKLNKKVNLVLLGEQTELDKTVMEKIGDPLVHLVRNSVDHGIETPEERKAKGKDETGTVTLNAYHQGGNIVIEISDDGAGINKERVLAKARERGLVAADEIPSDEKIYDMIFHPGFSTAAEISDVSGRGVGMDVVKKNIRALGGNIDITSATDQGSTIRIRLPLTLAILDGQLIRVGNETFIVPLVSIIESIQVKEERVNEIAGKAELYKLRDEYIPIVRLYEAFSTKPDSRNLTDGLLVVVEGDGQRVALFVDDLLGQQQVVIKSLETNYRSVEGVSGATILGDGTVALILDVSGLIVLSKSSGGTPGGGRKSNKDSTELEQDMTVNPEQSAEKAA
jgi:two-component system chemotaxis sensor kinase CheA